MRCRASGTNCSHRSPRSRRRFRQHMGSETRAERWRRRRRARLLKRRERWVQCRASETRCSPRRRRRRLRWRPCNGSETRAERRGPKRSRWVAVSALTILLSMWGHVHPQRAVEGSREQASQLEEELATANARVQVLESGAASHAAVRPAAAASPYPRTHTVTSSCLFVVYRRCRRRKRDFGRCVTLVRVALLGSLTWPAQQLEGLAREAKNLHGQYARVVAEVGELREVRQPAYAGSSARQRRAMS